MLELKQYTKSEIAAILGVRSKQGIERKLIGYGVEFSSSGWGDSVVYEIQKIHDKFKIFCITEMGIHAGTNFEKLKEFYYYLFCDENFAGLPTVEKSRIMSRNGVSVSRQTISNWLNKLECIGYIHLSTAEYTYYAIRKISDDNYYYREISRELYNKGWSTYWELLEDDDSNEAYKKMNTLIGGHPYKCPKIDQNAIHAKEIKTLIELIKEPLPE